MDEDEADLYEDEVIINSTTVKVVVQYRVRCACCTEVEDKLEPINNLENSADKLKEFRQKFY